MTTEELAIKYGFYRWDEEGKCYICSPSFLADVESVIKTEMCNTKMYRIMRRQLVEVMTENHNEEKMWRDIINNER